MLVNQEHRDCWKSWLLMTWWPLNHFSSPEDSQGPLTQYRMVIISSLKIIGSLKSLMYKYAKNAVAGLTIAFYMTINTYL